MMAIFPQDRDGPATRARIVETVAQHPGASKSEVCRLTGLSWGTVSHHLAVLAREGAVVSKPAGSAVRFRLPGVTSQQALIVRLLSGDIPLRLVEELAGRPGLRLRDLTLALGVSRKIIRRHLMTLEEAGV